MLYRDITELIGNTPLLRLDPAVHGLTGVELYAKLEFFNPFGSVKDRVAWGMLQDDIASVVTKGERLIEASSGNTAKALGILAAMRGVGMRAVTNRIKVTEVRDMLRLLNIELEELPGLSECPDPTTPNDVYSVIDATMRAQPGKFRHLSQYTNEKNIHVHSEGTGREIQEDLGKAGITSVDYLFGGLGTTGSTRGTATYLRKNNRQLRTVAVVSERTDFIPGIRSEREMWEVGLFQPEFYDQIVTISAEEAIDATVNMVTGYGLLAGPTSGAAYAAALKTISQREHSLEKPLVAVVIVCDRLEPYLSYIKQRRPELFGGTPRAHSPTPAELAAVPFCSPQELAELTQAFIVDTRGAMAYRIAHIPGAMNFPDDQLTAVLAHGTPFSSSQPVVFTCPTGELSVHFAALCRRTGHEALSLRGGITAWRSAGLPWERGARQ